MVIENIVVKLLRRSGQLDDALTLTSKHLPCSMDSYLKDNSAIKIFEKITASDYVGNSFHPDNQVDPVMKENNENVDLTLDLELKQFDKQSKESKGIVTICLDDDSDVEIVYETPINEPHRQRRQDGPINTISFVGGGEGRRSENVDSAAVPEVISSRQTGSKTKSVVAEANVTLEANNDKKTDLDTTAKDSITVENIVTLKEPLKQIVISDDQESNRTVVPPKAKHSGCRQDESIDTIIQDETQHITSCESKEEQRIPFEDGGTGRSENVDSAAVQEVISSRQTGSKTKSVIDETKVTIEAKIDKKPDLDTTAKDSTTVENDVTLKESLKQIVKSDDQESNRTVVPPKAKHSGCRQDESIDTIIQDETQHITSCESKEEQRIPFEDGGTGRSENVDTAAVQEVISSRQTGSKTKSVLDETKVTIEAKIDKKPDLDTTAKDSTTVENDVTLKESLKQIVKSDDQESNRTVVPPKAKHSGCRQDESIDTIIQDETQHITSCESKEEQRIPFEDGGTGRSENVDSAAVQEVISSRQTGSKTKSVLDETKVTIEAKIDKKPDLDTTAKDCTTVENDVTLKESLTKIVISDHQERNRTDVPPEAKHSDCRQDESIDTIIQDETQHTTSCASKEDFETAKILNELESTIISLNTPRPNSGDSLSTKIVQVCRNPEEGTLKSSDEVAYSITLSNTEDFTGINTQIPMANSPVTNKLNECSHDSLASVSNEVELVDQADFDTASKSNSDVHEAKIDEKSDSDTHTKDFTSEENDVTQKESLKEIIIYDQDDNRKDVPPEAIHSDSRQDESTNRIIQDEPQYITSCESKEEQRISSEDGGEGGKSENVDSAAVQEVINSRQTGSKTNSELNEVSEANFSLEAKLVKRPDLHTSVKDSTTVNDITQKESLKQIVIGDDQESNRIDVPPEAKRSRQDKSINTIILHKTPHITSCESEEEQRIPFKDGNDSGRSENGDSAAVVQEIIIQTRSNTKSAVAEANISLENNDVEEIVVEESRQRKDTDRDVIEDCKGDKFCEESASTVQITTRSRSKHIVEKSLEDSNIENCESATAEKKIDQEGLKGKHKVVSENPDATKILKKCQEASGDTQMTRSNDTVAERLDIPLKQTCVSTRRTTRSQTRSISLKNCQAVNNKGAVTDAPGNNNKLELGDDAITEISDIPDQKETSDSVLKNNNKFQQVSSDLDNQEAVINGDSHEIGIKQLSQIPMESVGDSPTESERSELITQSDIASEKLINDISECEPITAKDTQEKTIKIVVHSVIVLASPKKQNAFETQSFSRKTKELTFDIKDPTVKVGDSENVKDLESSVTSQIGTDNIVGGAASQLTVAKEELPQEDNNTDLQKTPMQKLQLVVKLERSKILNIGNNKGLKDGYVKDVNVECSAKNLDSKIDISSDSYRRPIIDESAVSNEKSIEPESTSGKILDAEDSSPTEISKFPAFETDKYINLETRTNDDTLERPHHIEENTQASETEKFITRETKTNDETQKGFGDNTSVEKLDIKGDSTKHEIGNIVHVENVSQCLIENQIEICQTDVVNNPRYSADEEKYFEATVFETEELLEVVVDNSESGTEKSYDSDVHLGDALIYENVSDVSVERDITTETVSEETISDGIPSSRTEIVDDLNVHNEEIVPYHIPDASMLDHVAVLQQEQQPEKKRGRKKKVVGEQNTQSKRRSKKVLLNEEGVEYKRVTRNATHISSVANFKPDDFLSQKKKFSLPTNNVYEHKIAEVNITSEESNDSERNNLLIDEGIDTKDYLALNNAEVIPEKDPLSIYDEDTLDEKLSIPDAYDAVDEYRFDSSIFGTILADDTVINEIFYDRTDAGVRDTENDLDQIPLTESLQSAEIPKELQNENEENSLIQPDIAKTLNPLQTAPKKKIMNQYKQDPNLMETLNQTSPEDSSHKKYYTTPKLRRKSKILLNCKSTVYPTVEKLKKKLEHDVESFKEAGCIKKSLELHGEADKIDEAKVSPEEIDRIIQKYKSSRMGVQISSEGDSRNLDNKVQTSQKSDRLIAIGDIDLKGTQTEQTAATSRKRGRALTYEDKYKPEDFEQNILIEEDSSTEVGSDIQNKNQQGLLKEIRTDKNRAGHKKSKIRSESRSKIKSVDKVDVLEEVEKESNINKIEQQKALVASEHPEQNKVKVKRGIKEPNSKIKSEKSDPDKGDLHHIQKQNDATNLLAGKFNVGPPGSDIQNKNQLSQQGSRKVILTHKNKTEHKQSKIRNECRSKSKSVDTAEVLEATEKENNINKIEQKANVPSEHPEQKKGKGKRGIKESNSEIKYEKSDRDKRDILHIPKQNNATNLLEGDLVQRKHDTAKMEQKVGGTSAKSEYAEEKPKDDECKISKESMNKSFEKYDKSRSIVNDRKEKAVADKEHADISEERMNVDKSKLRRSRPKSIVERDHDGREIKSGIKKNETESALKQAFQKSKSGMILDDEKNVNGSMNLSKDKLCIPVKCITTDIVSDAIEPRLGRPESKNGIVEINDVSKGSVEKKQGTDLEKPQEINKVAIKAQTTEDSDHLQNCKMLSKHAGSETIDSVAKSTVQSEQETEFECNQTTSDIAEIQHLQREGRTEHGSNKSNSMIHTDDPKKKYSGEKTRKDNNNEEVSKDEVSALPVVDSARSTSESIKPVPDLANRTVKRCRRKYLITQIINQDEHIKSEDVNIQKEDKAMDLSMKSNTNELSGLGVPLQEVNRYETGEVSLLDQSCKENEHQGEAEALPIEILSEEIENLRKTKLEKEINDDCSSAKRARLDESLAKAASKSSPKKERKTDETIVNLLSGIRDAPMDSDISLKTVTEAVEITPEMQKDYHSSLDPTMTTLPKDQSDSLENITKAEIEPHNTPENDSMISQSDNIAVVSPVNDIQNTDISNESVTTIDEVVKSPEAEHLGSDLVVFVEKDDSNVLIGNCVSVVESSADTRPDEEKLEVPAHVAESVLLLSDEKPCSVQHHVQAIDDTVEKSEAEPVAPELDDENKHARSKILVDQNTSATIVNPNIERINSVEEMTGATGLVDVPIGKSDLEITIEQGDDHKASDSFPEIVKNVIVTPYNDEVINNDKSQDALAAPLHAIEIIFDVTKSVSESIQPVHQNNLTTSFEKIDETSLCKPDEHMDEIISEVPSNLDAMQSGDIAPEPQTVDFIVEDTVKTIIATDVLPQINKTTDIIPHVKENSTSCDTFEAESADAKELGVTVPSTDITVHATEENGDTLTSKMNTNEVNTSTSHSKAGKLNDKLDSGRVLTKTNKEDEMFGKEALSLPTTVSQIISEHQPSSQIQALTTDPKTADEQTKAVPVVEAEVSYFSESTIAEQLMELNKDVLSSTAEGLQFEVTITTHSPGKSESDDHCILNIKDELDIGEVEELKDHNDSSSSQSYLGDTKFINYYIIEDLLRDAEESKGDEGANDHNYYNAGDPLFSGKSQENSIIPDINKPSQTDSNSFPQQTMDFGDFENNDQLGDANEYAVNNLLLLVGQTTSVTNPYHVGRIGLTDIKSMDLMEESAVNKVPNKSSDFSSGRESCIQCKNEENPNQLDTHVEANPKVVVVPNERLSPTFNSATNDTIVPFAQRTVENSPSSISPEPEPSANFPSTEESDSEKCTRTATTPRISEKRTAKPAVSLTTPTRKNSRTPVVAPKKKHPSHKVEETKDTKNELKRPAEDILPPPSKIAKLIETSEKKTPKGKNSVPMPEHKSESSSSQESAALGHTDKPLVNSTPNNSDSVVYELMYDVIKQRKRKSRFNITEKEAPQPQTKPRKSTCSSASGKRFPLDVVSEPLKPKGSETLKHVEVTPNMTDNLLKLKSVPRPIKNLVEAKRKSSKKRTSKRTSSKRSVSNKHASRDDSSDSSSGSSGREDREKRQILNNDLFNELVQQGNVNQNISLITQDNKLKTKVKSSAESLPSSRTSERGDSKIPAKEQLIRDRESHRSNERPRSCHEYPYNNGDSMDSRSTSSSKSYKKRCSTAPHSQSFYPYNGSGYKSTDYERQERPNKTFDEESLKKLALLRKKYEKEKHAQQGSSSSGASEWYSDFYKFFGEATPFQQNVPPRTSRREAK
ncbi:unnamed protein product [Acanthoscelides obtectus]|uniref:Uncharacterized protein n=1 Tax=Acanthoscelides obtectus TaxID=200917 RepID=A0A9P0K5H5_ACAOB|nr:unnamed protein product [Acanthoscelides obtectus]CAK1654106.1 hypothetical protein AOBTE_LOCUS18454 [Acanthoscelides obtectus]